MPFVTIPFDFEDFGSNNRIEPIVINDTDRFGRIIAPEWFAAVVPIADLLRELARRRLEDVRRVSELTELSVHALWYKHEYDFGVWPQWRVYWNAKGRAEELRRPWRMRKGLEIALGDLEAVLRAQGDFAADYERRELVDLLRKELHKAGQDQAVDILDQVLHGCPWNEVALNLGEQPNERTVNTLQRRFWRTVRRFVDTL